MPDTVPAAARPQPHSFHIPVMGSGFTIDTPLRVARFGIGSVMSLVDDELVERVRASHALAAGWTFAPIAADEPDARARRITAWLDFLDEVTREQVETMAAGTPDPGSDFARYFELLPEGEDRRLFEGWRSGRRDAGSLDRMRARVVRGAIDVNIMTKLDRSTRADGTPRRPEDSDAVAALRGFALSTLEGSLVLSAGLNPRLYAAIGEYAGFRPDPAGRIRKKITLKVSDVRSAETQAKYLARRGVWVSEFRVESGLNCGGHAFATEGLLMGPILAEFRDRRRALQAELFASLAAALEQRGHPVPAAPPPQRVTAQGGLGNAAEQRLLLEEYRVDATGWGTPFLSVPEVTLVDPETLRRLHAAGRDDIRLSASSPLGVPFWNLMTSESEDARRERLDAGRPGTPCFRGHLASDTSFGPAPLCPASRAWQKARAAAGPVPPEAAAKSCICHDLGGSALRLLTGDRRMTPAICPGPNAVNFRGTYTLGQMVDHIYGRAPLDQPPDRPHMFLTELELYLQLLEGRVPGPPGGIGRNFASNLADGIDHLDRLARRGLLGDVSFALAALDRARERAGTSAVGAERHRPGA